MLKSVSAVALLGAIVLFGTSNIVVAAPLTPGNLIVYRVGDGAAALGTTATAVILDEYTTAGSLVQSIPITTTGTTALTATGNSTTEGIISLSQDGTTLVFAGYRKDAGGTNPSADAPATTNRVIGTVKVDGTVNTSVGLTDPTGSIRSATTVNNSTYYIATSAAVRYVGTPGGTATSTLIDARNSRQVNVVNNTLYASNGSTTITAKVQSYGTLPTGATTPTAVVNLALADAVNGFVVLDLSAGVAGPDTIYALSTVESLLRKYSFDGTNWNAAGSLSSTALEIAAMVNGTDVDLYLTTAAALSKLTDTSGFGGTLTGTVSPLAPAGTNTAFRGVGVVVPEPGVAGILLVAPLVMGWRRRR